MKCFYVPGSRCIIDTIKRDSDRSSICNESLEQVQASHPGAEVWEMEDACHSIHTLTYADCLSAPVEVTEARWDEMLNVLPPMNWRNDHGTESFMICEAQTLDLHSIFCRLGDRYFEMTNRRGLNHAEIVEICKAVHS